MAWIRTEERLPPYGKVVQAAFGGGSIMDMRYDCGRWFYAHVNAPTSHTIKAWYEDDKAKGAS